MLGPHLEKKMRRFFKVLLFQIVNFLEMTHRSLRVILVTVVVDVSHRDMCIVAEEHAVELNVLIFNSCSGIRWKTEAQSWGKKKKRCWSLRTHTRRGKSFKITFLDLVHSSCSRQSGTWNFMRFSSSSLEAEYESTDPSCSFSPTLTPTLPPDMCRFIRWIFFGHRHIHDLSSHNHLLVPLLTSCSAFLFFIR